MIEQRVDDVAAAVHQVEHAWRQSDVIDELEHLLHRQRHALGGLMTTVLPHAIAYGRNQNGIIPGN